MQVKAAIKCFGMALILAFGTVVFAQEIDWQAVDEALGITGEMQPYTFSIPRVETITAHETEIPPAMGTAIALNFQPTNEGQVAINGDFVVIADEVNAVVRALRENNIDVVSLHNHMTTEEPRLFFMHFWRVGDAVELARGLRAALDQVYARKAK